MNKQLYRTENIVQQINQIYNYFANNMDDFYTQAEEYTRDYQLCINPMFFLAQALYEDNALWCRDLAKYIEILCQK